jgi:hypothetical protein
VRSIRHRSRSPFAAIADAVLYEQAASRRPSHALKLNPNSGPVHLACDIEYCTVLWPVGKPLLYALISQKALAGRVIHHDTAFSQLTRSAGVSVTVTLYLAPQAHMCVPASHSTNSVTGETSRR